MLQEKKIDFFTLSFGLVSSVFLLYFLKEMFLSLMIFYLNQK